MTKDIAYDKRAQGICRRLTRWAPLTAVYREAGVSAEGFNPLVRVNLLICFSDV